MPSHVYITYKGKTYTSDGFLRALKLSRFDSRKHVDIATDISLIKFEQNKAYMEGK